MSEQQRFIALDAEGVLKLIGPFASQQHAEDYVTQYGLKNASFEIARPLSPAEFKEELRIYRLRQDWKAAVENDETEDGFSTWVRQKDAELRMLNAQANAQHEKLPAPGEAVEEQLELTPDTVVAQQLS